MAVEERKEKVKVDCGMYVSDVFTVKVVKFKPLGTFFHVPRFGEES